MVESHTKRGNKKNVFLCMVPLKAAPTAKCSKPMAKRSIHRKRGSKAGQSRASLHFGGGHSVENFTGKRVEGLHRWAL